MTTLRLSAVGLPNSNPKPASLLLPLGRSHRKQPPMTSLNLRAGIYDPKTLAAMDQAFAAVWRMLRADEPFRDYANDTAIGTKRTCSMR